MEELSVELQMKILLELPYEELLSKCSTSSSWKSICDDNYFWESKTKIDYNKSSKPDNLTWKQFYKSLYQKDYCSPKNLTQILSKVRRIQSLSPAFECIKDAVISGNLERLKGYLRYRVIEKLEDGNIQYLIGLAFSNGNLSIIWFLIDNYVMKDSSEWQRVVSKLLQYGIYNQKLYNLIDKSGESPTAFVYDSLGYIDNLNFIVEFISRYQGGDDATKNMLNGVAHSGNIKIIEKLKLKPKDVQRLIFKAAEFDQLNFVKYLLEMYSGVISPNELLLGSTNLGARPEIMRLALNRGANNLEEALDPVLNNKYGFYSEENMESAVDLALEYGYNNYDQIVKKTINRTNKYYILLKNKLTPSVRRTVVKSFEKYTKNWQPY